MEKLTLTITEGKNKQGGNILIHDIRNEKGEIIKTHIADGYSQENKRKVVLVCTRELYKDGVTPTGEFVLEFSFAVSVERLKKSFNWKYYATKYEYQILEA